MPTLTTYRSIAATLWLFVGGFAGLTVASTINASLKQFPFYIILSSGIVYLLIVAISNAVKKNADNEPDTKSLPDDNKKMLTAPIKQDTTKHVSTPKVSSDEAARLWLDNFLQEQQKKDSQ